MVGAHGVQDVAARIGSLCVIDLESFPPTVGLQLLHPLFSVFTGTASDLQLLHNGSLETPLWHHILVLLFLAFFKSSFLKTRFLHFANSVANFLISSRTWNLFLFLVASVVAFTASAATLPNLSSPYLTCNSLPSFFYYEMVPIPQLGFIQIKRRRVEISRPHKKVNLFSPVSRTPSTKCVRFSTGVTARPSTRHHAIEISLWL